MSVPTATQERRVRRHPYWGDQEIATPALDALEAERREIEQAEAEHAEMMRVQAEKIAKARETLSTELEPLKESQARLIELMHDFVGEYNAGWHYRQSVDQARGVLALHENEACSEVPLTLALQASVGGDHQLRQIIERFRVLAMSGGEV
jgi:hypothetical protein